MQGRILSCAHINIICRDKPKTTLSAMSKLLLDPQCIAAKCLIRHFTTAMPPMVQSSVLSTSPFMP